MWPTGVDRHAAKGQLRDKGHREQGEAELWSSGDEKGGPAAWGPGTACEALGRPERQTGRPHGLQH